MASTQIEGSTTRRSLRLWPGVLLVALQWVLRFVVPAIAPDAGAVGVIGALACGLGIILWWAFFSRAPVLERLGALGLMVVGLVVGKSLLHASIDKAGMGMLFFIYAAPVLSLALVVWAVLSRRLAPGPRWMAMAGSILLACLMWTPLRTSGVAGDGHWDFSWRWSQTREDQLLARGGDEPTAMGSALVGTESEAEWPGFRGQGRDGVLRGVTIETDWSRSPPVELWRRPVGPGWSSFAVLGDFFYTQEQRGEEEVVTCYSATTGQPVWRHADATRFWEAEGGGGPRATPTISSGRVYSFGASGILNVLDAGDGTVVWSRNTTSDTGREIPGWGFASSPLVVGDVVLVHAGALVAYDLANGDPRWIGPPSVSYSSPHFLTLQGVSQVVVQSGSGVTGFALEDGAKLWEHPFTGGIVQPALTADGDLLLSAGGMTGGLGVRRIAVVHGANGWTTEERWTSRRLKPNFNDFVVHQGHAYGFDGSILASVELKDGKRAWKGGRYGNGQLLLLADQDVLLVLSERGELALVAALPDQFKEIARVPALEGKTWNHPVLVGDLLLVRNAQEMAAFRLPLVGA